MDKKYKISSYYLPKIRDYKDDYKILGWEDRDSHISRFQSFITNFDIKRYDTFLDVGCGLGTILEYFKDSNITINYTGVDILEEMIVEAKRRHSESLFYNVDVFKEDKFTQTFDIVYASGIFNIDLGNNKLFLKRAITRFYTLANSIIGFNLLHHNSKNRESGYFYFSPEDTVKMIERSGLKFKKIEIIEQYLDNDFTVICEKP